MNKEKVIIGQVACDFINQGDFSRWCEASLETNRFNHVVTLNPEMVMLAQRNKSFLQAIESAELRVPDGAGLIWARWYLRSAYWPLWPSLIAFAWQEVERVTGVEAVTVLADLCNRHDKLLYLVGGTPVQVSRTADKLRNKWPNLRVAVANDYAFKVGGPQELIADIREKQPAVLLVAYGAPKQAQWLAASRGLLPSVRIGMGVGGAFTMIGEVSPRAPKWLRSVNLEWLWRLLLEPSRWPRIWQATVQFPLLISKQKKQN